MRRPGSAPKLDAGRWPSTTSGWGLGTAGRSGPGTSRRWSLPHASLGRPWPEAPTAWRAAHLVAGLPAPAPLGADALAPGADPGTRAPPWCSCPQRSEQRAATCHHEFRHRRCMRCVAAILSLVASPGWEAARAPWLGGEHGRPERSLLWRRANGYKAPAPKFGGGAVASGSTWCNSL